MQCPKCKEKMSPLEVLAIGRRHNHTAMYECIKCTNIYVLNADKVLEDMLYTKNDYCKELQSDRMFYTDIKILVINETGYRIHIITEALEKYFFNKEVNLDILVINHSKGNFDDKIKHIKDKIEKSLGKFDYIFTDLSFVEHKNDILIKEENHRKVSLSGNDSIKAITALNSTRSNNIDYDSKEFIDKSILEKTKIRKSVKSNDKVGCYNDFFGDLFLRPTANVITKTKIDSKTVFIFNSNIASSNENAVISLNKLVKKYEEYEDNFTTHVFLANKNVEEIIKKITLLGIFQDKVYKATNFVV